MKTKNSEGECQLCHQTHKQGGMSKHLTKHLEKLNEVGDSLATYHLKIEADFYHQKSPYFMHLLVEGAATFEDLDYFLREIWLECCGHISAFRNKKMANSTNDYGQFGMMDAYEYLEQGETAKYEEMMEAINGEIPMRKSLHEVLYVLPNNTVLEYEYDMGSSTNLTISLVGKYAIKCHKEITLLSINNPIIYTCESCKKETAIVICTDCDCEDKAALFCDKCATKHKKTCEAFSDYSALPIVNSPRMGVCAYTGNELDLNEFLPEF